MSSPDRQETYAIFGAGRQGHALHTILGAHSRGIFAGFIDDDQETNPAQKIFNIRDGHRMPAVQRILIPYYGTDAHTGTACSERARRLTAIFPNVKLVQLPAGLDLAAVDVLECCDSFSLLLPRPSEAPASALFGMTTAGEQAYYAQTVIDLADRPGALVDLGCWMGSTSIALAQGLSQTGGSDPIYAFDRFIWEDWMKICTEGLRCKYNPGESFLPEVRWRIREFDQVIQLIQADLTQYVWIGGSIKLLLVDAMKNWELTRSIAEQFYPSLEVGSCVIHQDFKFHAVPWIHLLQYRLRDAFQLRCDVPYATTVAFDVLRSVSLEEVRAAAQLDQVTDEEVAAAIAYFMSQFCEQGQASLAAAHMFYFVLRQRPREALSLLEKYSSESVALTVDFLAAKEKVMHLAGKKAVA